MLNLLLFTIDLRRMLLENISAKQKLSRINFKANNNLINNNNTTERQFNGFNSLMDQNRTYINKTYINTLVVNLM